MFSSRVCFPSRILTGRAFPRKRSAASPATAAWWPRPATDPGLNIGRRARSIPPAIRRALTLRDRGCCFPGCTHTLFLHGHHIQHWLHGARPAWPTSRLLCTFHHHLVHEGGWTIARGENGELAFSAPDGRALAAEPPRQVVDDVRWQ